MFAAFLSKDMTYSCPIWLSLGDKRSSIESLEEAQDRKLQYFISEAKIKSSDHVLEIGTPAGEALLLQLFETQAVELRALL